jgi:general secretion pathway protein G
MRKQGFTLVEILIVVVILGILAAIVIPHFTIASTHARGNSLKDQLFSLRTQISVFEAQHGFAPGYADGDTTSDPDQDLFVQQMTRSSDRWGTVAEPGTEGYDFGPYFTEIPPNPVNSLQTVQILPNAQSLPGAGDDSHGWIFHPASMTLKSDAIGADDEGVPFYQY